MDDEGAFLKEIIDNPDDDTPRLVYADWLQDGDRTPQANFIRSQVRAAAECPGRYYGRDRSGSRQSGSVNLGQILNSPPWEWDWQCPEESQLEGPDPRKHHGDFDIVTYSTTAVVVVWRRGFVEGVMCQPGSLYRFRDDLYRHPVREILARKWAYNPLFPAPASTSHYPYPDIFSLFRNTNEDAALAKHLRQFFPALLGASYKLHGVGFLRNKFNFFDELNKQVGERSRQKYDADFGRWSTKK